MSQTCKKNTDILPTRRDRKITEVPRQEELLKSHSETSLQAMAMKNLFYAVIAFHAVLIQCDCTFCAIVWRDFPICRFQMMKKLIQKSLGSITVQTTGFYGVLAIKFPPAAWLGNHTE